LNNVVFAKIFLTAVAFINDIECRKWLGGIKKLRGMSMDYQTSSSKKAFAFYSQQTKSRLPLTAYV